MDLNKIGRSRVVTADRDATLEEAARIMRESHTGDVVIVERQGAKRIPVGILTDRDIVMATIALGVPVEPLLAGDVMTSGLVTAREDDSLGQVIDLMKEKGVKRVPLVGASQELVGIVSLEDVLSFLAAEFTALSAVARRQKEVESERRRKVG